MKHIRYISDIHLDWDSTWCVPPMEEDVDTTLVIAGDLWKEHRHLKQYDSLSWLAKTASQFKYVVYVLGNHDYWNARLDTAIQHSRELAVEQKIHNVFLLEASSIELDGITFVGGTLWTNYGIRNLISIMEAKNYMNDYKLTRVGVDYRKMTPYDCLKIFDHTKKEIFRVAKECKEAGKQCIVVTHMAPSCGSVNEKYRNERDNLSNTWYYSELGNYIVDSGISHWIHGHIHNACNYVIGDVNVLCNPKGYVGEGSTGFDCFARIGL